jgi:hypothetical protein
VNRHAAVIRGGAGIGLRRARRRGEAAWAARGTIIAGERSVAGKITRWWAETAVTVLEVAAGPLAARTAAEPAASILAAWSAPAALLSTRSAARAPATGTSSVVLHF